MGALFLVSWGFLFLLVYVYGHSTACVVAFLSLMIDGRVLGILRDIFY
jgi:hypothetical protein